MQKGAYLEVTLQHAAGADTANTPALVQATLSGDHDGLRLTVLKTSADQADPTKLHAVVYAEGDQAPADDFEQLASSTVQRLWQAGPAAPAAGPGPLTDALAAPKPQLLNVGKWEGYDEWDPPAPAADALAPGPAQPDFLSRKSCLAPVTGGGNGAAPAVVPLAPIAAPSAPVNGDFDGCPAGGDSAGEAVQNGLKNRTDSGDWQPTTVAAILALPVPPGLAAQRDEWSADDQAAIAQYEGLPLQVVGFLAGARAEGPESCNCHSTTDVDYHLWLVDVSGTGRDASVVVEVTPRIRADHPNWDVERICSLLVTPQTQVRISGWLMMDPVHADQVGNTRGTLWEIHPILAIEALQNDAWVALDEL